MTTGEMAVAEAYRLANIIARQPPGWRTRVNVQDWAPNAPRYSWTVMGPVDHCGLSLNHIMHNIGLRMGEDFPDSAWTPSGLQWFVSRGLIVPWEDVPAGDYIYFRNAGSPYAATHVGMVTGRFGGNAVPTMEYNTDTTGHGRRYLRQLNGYPVAAGRPRYRKTPPPPPVAVSVGNLLAGIY